MRPWCKGCGGTIKRGHYPNCPRALEIQADKLLMNDRHETCSGKIACKTKFYLDRQYESRRKKEPPSGLAP
jgi:hypothetical protein